MNKRFQAILLGVVVALAMGGSGAYANCVNLGGYAIFQCGDSAYFAPPPVAPVLDPNANPINYSAVFWQIGFGNAILNSGLGSNGTGNSGLNTFNGNDSGQWVVDLKDAFIATTNTAIPPGALCLSVNNLANQGVDGCMDQNRTTNLLNDQDNILNPDYNVYYSLAGNPGYYAYAWHQDYPIAVLAKSVPDAKFFAIGAVSTLFRNDDHTPTGPCAITPGTNQAACDFRTGVYNFRDIKNGALNVATGENNVIAWQQVPRPRAACIAGCTGTVTNRTINFNWDPVKVVNDQRHIGTANPAMGGSACDGGVGCLAPGPDLTRAAGVGTLDVMKNANPDPNNNWAGLVRYDLEAAPVTATNIDPNGNVIFSSLVFAAATGAALNIVQPGLTANGDPTGLVTLNGVSAPPNTCYRVHVKFGHKSEIATTPTASCRIGKCGDKGYEAFSLDPATITCVGGSLLSETAVNLQAVKKLGGVTLTWKMTTELSLEGFNIYAVSAKGVEKKIGSLPCQSCTTGESKSYSFTAPMTQVKGAKSLVLEVLSTNGNSRSAINF